MKRFYYLALLLLSSFSLFAQEEDPNMAYGSLAPWHTFEENKVVTAFTAVTDANVRDKPNTTAAVVAKLPIATKVTIEMVTTDTMKLNGYNAPWCKVSYLLGDKKQTGYLWGGGLAAVAFEVKDEYDENRKDLIYVAGVSKVDAKGEKWTMHIRAVRKGVELAKTEVTQIADVGYFAQLKNLGSLGFDKALDAVDFNLNYPACGYAYVSNLIIFTGKKLTPVLETTSVSDAGAFYSSEDYIIPSEKGGIANHIIFVKSSAEYEEKEVKKDEFVQVLQKQEYSIALYKWTGEKLVKIKELK